MLGIVWGTSLLDTDVSGVSEEAGLLKSAGDRLLPHDTFIIIIITIYFYVLYRQFSSRMMIESNYLKTTDQLS
jgi:hypothetical protein